MEELYLLQVQIHFDIEELKQEFLRVRSSNEKRILSHLIGVKIQRLEDLGLQ